MPSAARISPCTSPLHHSSQALALTLLSFAPPVIACSYTDFNSEGLSAINRPTSLSISHSTPNLKVTHSEATRLHSTHTSLLHSTKRLTLIVDLDQTVVHATVDPTVGDWMEDLTRPETERRLKGEEGRRNMKEVGRFTLDERGGNGCWYYLKPRSVFSSSSSSCNQVRNAPAGPNNVASITSQSNPPCQTGPRALPRADARKVRDARVHDGNPPVRQRGLQVDRPPREVLWRSDLVEGRER